jgi:hypothetical protein
MSDGERVIFYMLGHCLMARPNSIIIIDEPELHVHKAILARLSDIIEAERPDCAFVYITHDLDFVVARPTASKLLILSYSPDLIWRLELLPTDTGLPERVLSEIVGSRQPILFVEGVRGGLDSIIYRSAFPQHTVEPIGPCDAVIHAVASFRAHPSLHRLSGKGIVDSDGRNADEVSYLAKQDVHVLSVAEMENLLLLPTVFKQIALALHREASELDGLVDALTSAIIAEAEKDLETAAVRFASRQLDAELKKTAPKARTTSELNDRFQEAVRSLDPAALARSYQLRLSDAVAKRDLPTILYFYDNKGLLSIGAQLLGLKGREAFAEFVSRLLASPKAEAALLAIKEALPRIG